MADLEVQPKRSRPWWPWLLLLLIGLALLFYFVREGVGDQPAAADPEAATTTAGSAANPEPVPDTSAAYI
jgi:hypothetical protein